MKIINSVLLKLRGLRSLFLAFTCGLVLLVYSFPAWAISSYQSDVTEGTTQLLETQRQTDELAKKPPIGMREEQEKTSRGLNEVQGDADIEKMKRPENSQTATSVEQEVEGFLEKLTGNK